MIVLKKRRAEVQDIKKYNVDIFVVAPTGRTLRIFK